MSNSLSLTYIGKVHSPYKEKFAIPRQPNLVACAKAYIEISHDDCDASALKGIEEFSHLWVVFCFHATQAQGWKPLVRPPRLGGNKKVGVFATRSTFRPNPIGMSVVKLESIEHHSSHSRLNISGVDLLDQTPVLDIKPYLPYVDSIQEAAAGFAQHAPEAELAVEISPTAKQELSKLEDGNYLGELLVQVLKQDPRPAYKRASADDKVYGIKLLDYNIRWQMNGLDKISVLSIETYQ